MNRRDPERALVSQYLHVQLLHKLILWRLQKAELWPKDADILAKTG